MTFPGLIPAGGMSPRMLRIMLWGPLKSGKTVFCSTFPAPLFIHATVESGYDTFMLPTGQLMFPTIPVGQSHVQWVDSRQGTKVSHELDQIMLHLLDLVRMGTCPYQTVVIGGFSDIIELIHQEGTVLEKDSQKAWGYVSNWTGKFLSFLCTLPLHIIVEAAAATKRKNRSGTVISLRPDIAGKTGNLLGNKTNLILFQEALGNGIFHTHFSRVMRADPEEKANGILEYAQAASRIMGLNFTTPVTNCAYDHIAQAIGLPPIEQVDPGHPRCQPGLWPWPHPHM